jgi:DNA mismatch repair ATPase MutL
LKEIEFGEIKLFEKKLKTFQKGTRIVCKNIFKEQMIRRKNIKKEKEIQKIIKNIKEQTLICNISITLKDKSKILFKIFKNTKFNEYMDILKYNFCEYYVHFDIKKDIIEIKEKNFFGFVSKNFQESYKNIQFLYFKTNLIKNELIYENINNIFKEINNNQNTPFFVLIIYDNNFIVNYYDYK